MPILIPALLDPASTSSCASSAFPSRNLSVLRPWKICLQPRTPSAQSLSPRMLFYPFLSLSLSATLSHRHKCKPQTGRHFYLSIYLSQSLNLSLPPSFPPSPLLACKCTSVSLLSLSPLHLACKCMCIYACMRASLFMPTRRKKGHPHFSNW